MAKAIFIYVRNFSMTLWTLLLTMLLLSASSFVQAQQTAQTMLIRLAEIEIHEQHLDAYKAILKEEAESSVRLEKGVIAIFPMSSKEHPTQIRILELYADQAAYQAHLKTPHFLKYKNETAEMVKTLKLVDMHALDLEAATAIFGKMVSQTNETTKGKK